MMISNDFFKLKAAPLLYGIDGHPSHACSRGGYTIRTTEDNIGACAIWCSVHIFESENQIVEYVFNTLLMTIVVREHSLERRGEKFPGRQLVLLGEHDDDLAVNEPFRIDDSLEKDKLLEHSVLGAVFKKDSIVARDVTCEDDSIHVFKHMDPFLPLAPHAPEIEEMVDSVVMNEPRLIYTSGLRSAVEYILDGRDIIRIQDAI